MVTVKYNKNCDLCGLPVEIDGFSLEASQDTKSFCCAGCLSIYQLIYTNNPLTENKDQTNNNNEDI
ncbi:cation transport ATPase [Methyloglobulus morosus KoM1]|uniref:Cation transport ATPase n=1 Tax=Methyloglobulus morosus KoM1 TaxID=1116472 RepID=V5DU97_9GAMM|nr:heavy metal translocating P-type ATPase metal-binding domain-containing protein [Methyloglobulus morosus]ESS70996.1 cation transport ATPase [Methyloglobulus morosus KoM1]